MDEHRHYLTVLTYSLHFTDENTEALRYYKALPRWHPVHGRLTQELFGSKMQAHSPVLAVLCVPLSPEEGGKLAKRKKPGLGLPVPEEGWCPRWGRPALPSQTLRSLWDHIGLPSFHRCWNVGQERIVGWGCWACACITAISRVNGTWLAGPTPVPEIRKCFEIKVNWIIRWWTADLK